jgi:hypothetical protein
MLTQKAGLSPHDAPSRDHDFELVTPDVRAPPQVVAVLVWSLPAKKNNAEACIAAHRGNGGFDSRIGRHCRPVPATPMQNAVP